MTKKNIKQNQLAAAETTGRVVVGDKPKKLAAIPMSFRENRKRHPSRTTDAFC